MDTRSPASETSPWQPFENRRRARDEKREAVLRTAVQLFLEQGYHRATLNEVAERLNITKPALYNYFRSKDEILFECWAMGLELVETSTAAINAAGGSGLDKLRKMARAYGGLMATDFGASLVRFDVRDLGARHRDIVLAGKKSIDRTFRGYISDGIADGSIKPCDAKLSAFAIAGALNWIGHWYQRDGTLSPDAVGEQFAAQLTEGLATRPARKRAPVKSNKKAPKASTTTKRSGGDKG